MNPINPHQESQCSKQVAPKLGPDQSGATSLEWALLLGVIALPSYVVISLALGALVGYYQMLTMLNGMPFP